MALDLEGLLRFATENDASDVFLKSNTQPTVRLNGAVRKLDHPALTNDEIEGWARKMMTAEQWAHFQKHPDHDVSYVIPNVARFRFNIYRSMCGCAMCLRIVQLKIRGFEELGLPDVLGEFTRH